MPTARVRPISRIISTRWYSRETGRMDGGGMLNRMLPVFALCMIRSVGADPGCTAQIDAVPVIITTPGTYCVTAYLTTSLADGAAIEIQSDDVSIDVSNGASALALWGPGAYASQNRIVTTSTLAANIDANAIFVMGAPNCHVAENQIVNTEHPNHFARGVMIWQSPDCRLERNEFD